MKSAAVADVNALRFDLPQESVDKCGTLHSRMIGCDSVASAYVAKKTMSHKNCSSKATDGRAVEESSDTDEEDGGREHQKESNMLSDINFSSDEESRQSKVGHKKVDGVDMNCESKQEASKGCVFREKSGGGSTLMQRGAAAIERLRSWRLGP